MSGSSITKKRPDDHVAGAARARIYLHTTSQKADKMPPRPRRQRKAAPAANNGGQPRRPAPVATNFNSAVATTPEDAKLLRAIAESRRAAATAPLSEEAELQRVLAMSAQSYSAEQSQRAAYERYAAPAAPPRRAPAPPPRAPSQRTPPAGAALPPLQVLRERAERARTERQQREAKLTELARQPPPVQAEAEVVALLARAGLARYLPLLLAEEVADMETLRYMAAEDLKLILLPLGARAKLLHALQDPSWRPRR